MELVFENLRIRNARVEDAGLLEKWWNDGAVMAHAGFPQGLGTTAAAIAESLAKDTDADGRRLILEVSNTAIGEMSYRSKGNGTVEIGIKICHLSEQEKGYGTKFLSMLARALFCEYGYEKIILDTNLKNERAQRVYEKLGFRKLRVNHDAWKDQMGEMQSSVDYELEKSEYIS